MRFIPYFFIWCVFISSTFAFEASPPLTDREIIESLVELKAGQDKLNSRFDDVNSRFDDLKGLLYVVLAGIFGLFGFVLWDRRTALAPAIRKTKELEEKEEMIEKVLKELAREDPKVRDAMKHAGFIQ